MIGNNNNESIRDDIKVIKLQYDIAIEQKNTIGQQLLATWYPYLPIAKLYGQDGESDYFPLIKYHGILGFGLLINSSIYIASGVALTYFLQAAAEEASKYIAEQVDIPIEVLLEVLAPIVLIIITTYATYAVGEKLLDTHKNAFEKETLFRFNQICSDGAFFEYLKRDPNAPEWIKSPKTIDSNIRSIHHEHFGFTTMLGNMYAIGGEIIGVSLLSLTDTVSGTMAITMGFSGGAVLLLYVMAYGFSKWNNQLNQKIQDIQATRDAIHQDINKLAQENTLTDMRSNLEKRLNNLEELLAKYKNQKANRDIFQRFLQRILISIGSILNIFFPGVLKYQNKIEEQAHEFAASKKGEAYLNVNVLLQLYYQFQKQYEDARSAYYVEEAECNAKNEGPERVPAFTKVIFKINYFDDATGTVSSLEVELYIEFGKTYLFVGNSGAGKSTLLNLMSGLLGYGGNFVDIANCKISVPQNTKVSFVSQNILLDGAGTVRDNLMANFIDSNFFSDALLEDMLKNVKLKLEDVGDLNKKIDDHNPSGGVRRRLHIVRGLLGMFSYIEEKLNDESINEDVRQRHNDNIIGFGKIEDLLRYVHNHFDTDPELYPDESQRPKHMLYLDEVFAGLDKDDSNGDSSEKKTMALIQQYRKVFGEDMCVLFIRHFSGNLKETFHNTGLSEGMEVVQVTRDVRNPEVRVIPGSEFRTSPLQMLINSKRKELANPELDAESEFPERALMERVYEDMTMREYLFTGKEMDQDAGVEEINRHLDVHAMSFSLGYPKSGKNKVNATDFLNYDLYKHYRQFCEKYRYEIGSEEGYQKFFGKMDNFRAFFPDQDQEQIRDEDKPGTVVSKKEIELDNDVVDNLSIVANLKLAINNSDQISDDLIDDILNELFDYNNLTGAQKEALKAYKLQELKLSEAENELITMYRQMLRVVFDNTTSRMPVEEAQAQDAEWVAPTDLAHLKNDFADKFKRVWGDQQGDRTYTPIDKTDYEIDFEVFEGNHDYQLNVGVKAQRDGKLPLNEFKQSTTGYLARLEDYEAKCTKYKAEESKPFKYVTWKVYIGSYLAMGTAISGYLYLAPIYADFMVPEFQNEFMAELVSNVFDEPLVAAATVAVIAPLVVLMVDVLLSAFGEKAGMTVEEVESRR